MTRNELTKLVLLAQKGNKSAIEQIYLLTYNSAFNKICSAINNADDAEDILHDCYVSVISNLSNLKEPESFEKWFNTIIANKTKDYKKKKSPVLLDEGGYNALSHSPEENPNFIPHESIERADNIEVIRKLVDELSDKNRQSIEMHYFENKSISEIANELNVSENTVKTRLHNGRKEIKKKAKINVKKIFVTILILVLLAVITIFTVSSSGEFFTRILYKLHDTYSEFRVDKYYLSIDSETIKEIYSPTYIPEGYEIFEKAELVHPDLFLIYYEYYHFGDIRIIFNQNPLTTGGAFSLVDKNIKTFGINGYEVMYSSNDLGVLCFWDNGNYIFL